MDVPTSEPTVRWKGQYTGLDENSNKWWMVEFWENEGVMQTSHGRVGATRVCKPKRATRREVQALIDSKQYRRHQPYKEIDLHVPEVIIEEAGGEPIPKEISRIVNDIFTEAGDDIGSYLSVGVDSLSQNQISNGRLILSQVQYEYNEYLNAHVPIGNVIHLAEKYFNTIPTQLPHKITPEDVTHDLARNLADHEERLDQLEAALDTQAVIKKGASKYSSIGAEIKPVPTYSTEYENLVKYVQDSAGSHYNSRVKDVYEVEIPNEREAFINEQRGSNNIRNLFHGTKFGNLRHIMRTGLIIPSYAAHGSMFGRGIYFADASTKAGQYSSNRRAGYNILLVAQVKLGNQYIAKGTGDWTRPPDGYDSVWGKRGGVRGAWSGSLAYNEFVVYYTSQQTIRYLVTFNKL